MLGIGEDRVRVVKLGGRLLDNEGRLAGIASAIGEMITSMGAAPVIVHGGGAAIAELQARLGLEAAHVDGLRVTDADSMEVVRMVLSGAVNGRLVGALVSAGIDAQGLSGADRGLLRCRKLQPGGADIGFVGEVTSVRVEVLRRLVEEGVVPVLSPVSLGEDGRAYNVNADTAAAAVAAALRARQLDFVSDVPGVLVDGAIATELTPGDVEARIQDGSIAGGMVPKVRAALAAVERGVGRVRIVDLAGLADEASGTVITGRSIGAGHAIAVDSELDRDQPVDAESLIGAAPAVGAGHLDHAYPDLRTGHPGPDNDLDSGLDRDPVLPVDAESIIAADGAYILQTYARPPIVLTSGRGAWLKASDGRRFLDFNAGIAVNALGHADPEWAAAIIEQVRTLAHTSNLYHTAPATRLARRLVERSFADRVYFCNTGAEAIETAIKVARKAALVRALERSGEGPGDTGDLDEFGDDAPTGPTPARRIVAFERAFHGRSIGALSLTHKRAYREPFEPLMPDVTFVPFGDLDAARAVIDASTCAVFVEPVQGEGGYHLAPDGFLAGLRAACDELGALLVFDEVQCGLGRTGRLWAHEHWGVTPDIMAIAKPLAGGLPIGAALMTQRVADVMGVGDHGSTFAGGPLVCRAAEVVLDRVSSPGFLRDVVARGERLVAGLLALDSERIVEIRGLGLMIGVELDVPVKGVVEAARDAGVLLIGAGETTLRLCPPLIVGEAEIDLAIATIGRALAAQPAPGVTAAATRSAEGDPSAASDSAPDPDPTG